MAGNSNSGRKQRNSEGSRWMQCSAMAEVLGLSQNQVYYDLYEKLKEHNYISDIINKVKPTIQQVKNWPEYKQLVSRAGSGGPADAMKLALWFIDKCGSPEVARRAFYAAMVGLGAMEIVDKEGPRLLKTVPDVMSPPPDMPMPPMNDVVGPSPAELAEQMEREKINQEGTGKEQTDGGDNGT